MKYYDTNFLIIEYPTAFLGVPKKKLTARAKWKVAFTELTGEKIQFISKGDKLRGKSGERGHKSKQNLILVDVYAQKEDFIEAIKKFFSKKLNVRPQSLRFHFQSPQPLGDLNDT